MMNEQIERERGVHGQNWATVHEGYFSDAAVAAPLVRKIQELAGRSKANRIVDLGGGAGALLARLREAGVEPGVSLVNLDTSAVQLEAARRTGFACVRGSVDAFARRDIGPDDERFLYSMRSVLHYFGEVGLRPVLRHVRAQTKPGEFFVHQTASFIRPEDAACLNELYRLMRTPKWYPSVTSLADNLREEGWEVLEKIPARPLRLKQDDLMQRYQLDPADMRRIADRLSRDAHVPDDVFTMTNEGFCAYLHYWIYVCTPAIRPRS